MEIKCNSWYNKRTNRIVGMICEWIILQNTITVTKTQGLLNDKGVIDRWID